MGGLFPDIYTKAVEDEHYAIEEEEVVKRGRPQWHYDFKKQRFLRDEENKFIKIEKFASIQKWIEKIVFTSRDVWKIYDGTEYGSDFMNIVTSNFDDDLKVILLNKECKRVFPLHPEIKRVENVIVYSTISNTCLITFEIILLDGESFQGQLEL